MRIHHVTPEHPVNSSGSIFSDAMGQFLDAGMSLVDPARLAADPDALRELRGMHLLTIRLALLATEFFDADRCLSMVVPQHAAFYRRLIESRVVAEPTADTGSYNVSATLLASDYRDARQRVHRRFPFFRAQPHEMRMLFGDLTSFPSAPLTILPTARYALNRGHAAQEGMRPASAGTGALSRLGGRLSAPVAAEAKLRHGRRRKAKMRLYRRPGLCIPVERTATRGRRP